MFTNKLNNKNVQAILQHHQTIDQLRNQYPTKSIHQRLPIANSERPLFAKNADTISNMLLKHIATQYPKENITIASIWRSGVAMARLATEHFQDINFLNIDSHREEVVDKNGEMTRTIQKEMHGHVNPNDLIVLCDPMLATGGSMIEAIKEIKHKNPEARIVITSIIASKNGIQKVQDEYPDIPIVVAQIDPTLDHANYIVPGLGDFGDQYMDRITQRGFQEIYQKISTSTVRNHDGKVVDSYSQDNEGAFVERCLCSAQHTAQIIKDSIPEERRRVAKQRWQSSYNQILNTNSIVRY